MIVLHLPFPPSVNHYYRHIGHCTLISRKGREYRQAVKDLLVDRGLIEMHGPLDVVVELYPPDLRRRDCDNAMKAIFDSMQHGGVYRDDSQIVRMEVWKRWRVKGGLAIVIIRELNDARSNQSSAPLHIQQDRSDCSDRGLATRLPPGQRRQVRRQGGTQESKDGGPEEGSVVSEPRDRTPGEGPCSNKSS